MATRKHTPIECDQRMLQQLLSIITASTVKVLNFCRWWRSALSGARGRGLTGKVAFRVKLSRERLLNSLAPQPRCAVAMEACASAYCCHPRRLKGLSAGAVEAMWPGPRTSKGKRSTRRDRGESTPTREPSISHKRHGPDPRNLHAGQRLPPAAPAGRMDGRTRRRLRSRPPWAGQRLDDARAPARQPFAVNRADAAGGQFRATAQAAPFSAANRTEPQL